MSFACPGKFKFVKRPREAVLNKTLALTRYPEMEVSYLEKDGILKPIKIEALNKFHQYYLFVLIFIISFIWISFDIALSLRCRLTLLPLF